MSGSKFNPMPSHIGIIMDGNGRWAKERGLPREKGHIEGAEVFRKIGKHAGEIGIKYMSFYAFSTENWSRPETEVQAIMQLLTDYLTEAENKLQDNIKKGIRIRFLGDTSALSSEIVSKMNFLEAATADMDKINLNLAVNYGGQQEILRSVKRIAHEIVSGKIKPDAIALSDIERGLYTAEQPPVDFIIRSGGEQRLSNFLLWQSAYAEFWYSDVLWPDFSTDDFDNALRAYEKRKRRFGGI